MELGNLIFGHSRGQYEVPRGQWQDKFAELLDFFHLDYHGVANEKSIDKMRKKHNVVINDRDGIRTPKFEINPYYWGDDDSIIYIPNFIYFPTEYELMWYKYPLRDSYANQDITFKEFCRMIDDCKEV